MEKQQRNGWRIDNQVRAKIPLGDPQAKSAQRMLLKLVGVFLLGIVLIASTAPAHAQSQGSWAMKAPVPTPRTEVALAAVGGEVHVIGGSVEGVAGTYHDE